MVSDRIRIVIYIRQAFFFHRDDLDGGELRSAYPASVQAFRSAMDHSGHPGRMLSSPVSGYLFSPGPAAGGRPAVLHIGGYDGTAGQLYASAAPALDRGYVFAALDGPGQGSALRPARSDAAGPEERRAGQGQ